MRWLLGLVATFGSSLQAEAACVESDRLNRAFQVGDMVESTPPSELTIGKVLVRRDVDEPNAIEECSLSTIISVEVAATDDTTPSHELGVRVSFAGFGGDQLPSPTGSNFGLLKIVFRGTDFDLDFDLHVAALDSSGNVGPETVIPIHSDAPGCNAAGSWSLVPGLSILGLLRRRRRAHRSIARMRQSP